MRNDSADAGKFLRRRSSIYCLISLETEGESGTSLHLRNFVMRIWSTVSSVSKSPRRMRRSSQRRSPQQNRQEQTDANGLRTQRMVRGGRKLHGRGQ